MTKLSVTVPEAAEMIGIGRSSLYALFKEKKLTPRKSGKRTLILVDDLKRFVENLPAAS
jgi:excisionase family DNA binding protein